MGFEPMTTCVSDKYSTPTELSLITKYPVGIEPTKVGVADQLPTLD